MIQAKCIQKFRDDKGKIYGYRLIDLNGQTQDVQSDNLKLAIKNKKVHVVNLKLTSDNRLVDTTEKQLQTKVLGKAPVLQVVQNASKYSELAKNFVASDTRNRQEELFNNIHSMLQKYYPYTVHGLDWNDGASNYDYTKIIYFSCDYETNNCETLTIVEIWVDFKNKCIEICTDSSIGEENSVSVKTKQISEQDIKKAVNSFLEKMKL